MKQVGKANSSYPGWSQLSQTCEIIHLAEANNIIILYLPPHTTHKLQPLNIGVFGPFQRAWLGQCDYITELTGTEMPKEDFVKEYMHIRQETFCLSTVTSAFRKSGTWPIDKTVFTDDNFAPSISHSTEVPNFLQHPELAPLPPLGLDLDSEDSDSDSDSDNDSNGDSDSESHELLQTSHSHPAVKCPHFPISSSTPAPGPSTMSHTTSAPATDPAPIPGLLTLPPVSTSTILSQPSSFCLNYCAGEQCPITPGASQDGRA